MGQRFESSRARQIIKMKKILLLSLFIFSILHTHSRAETVYDLLISGEREKGIAILRDHAENESNKDAMYVLGLLYNDASTINLCAIDDFCLGQNFSNYKEAKKYSLNSTKTIMIHGLHTHLVSIMMIIGILVGIIKRHLNIIYFLLNEAYPRLNLMLPICTNMVMELEKTLLSLFAGIYSAIPLLYVELE